VHDAIVAALEMVLRETPWIQRVQSLPPFKAAQGHVASISGQKVEEVRETLEKYNQAPLPQRRFAPSEPFKYPPSAAPEPVIEDDEVPGEGYFSSLRIIGQYQAAYILCQDRDDLVIIDQHAAHERIAFERLKGEFAAAAVESQALLFPETLELTFKDAAALKENLIHMNRLGFSAEEFGGNTWLLHAVPRLLVEKGYVRILNDILEELQSIGKSRPFDDVVEAILARIACHSVVRGSQLLGGREIKALFSQMDASGFSAHCPHGRPVICKFTHAEITKMFKRG